MIRKYISIFCISAMVLLFFSGCNTNLSETPTTTVPDTQSTPDTSKMDFSFTDNDLDSSYDESTSTKINISETYEITKAGTYILSGNLNNKTFTINAGKEDKIKLVFNGISIANGNGPALYVKSAEKVFITLAENSENTLSDGVDYSVTDEDATLDATLFSREDLTINGNGKLIVKGNYKHGVVSKDDLIITSGVIDVTSKNTALCGKDCVKITKADITTNSGTDAIKSDNAEDATRGFVYIQSGNYNLTSTNDGIQAVTAINVADGTFKISSGDDAIHSDNIFTFSKGTIDIIKCYEGIEANHVTISGGNISINASDDGINATEPNDDETTDNKRPAQEEFAPTDSSITISGGYTYIEANGDGIDSNGSINISGGVTLISGPSSGPDTSFDYNGTATVTGGVFIGTSTGEMAQNFSEAKNQGAILYSFQAQQKENTTFSICDENDKVIVSFDSPKPYSAVVVTAPQIKEGGKYKIVVGAEIENSDKHGYANSSDKSGGTVLETIEMTSSLYGTSKGMPGGMAPGFNGGRPDGNFPDFDEMPSMPEGGFPQMPDGNMPEMPDGKFPGRPQGNPSEKPAITAK